MIAYVQKETIHTWETRVALWIFELVQSGESGWSADDLLHLDREDDARRISTFRSLHQRTKGLPRIELRHSWISMS